MKVGPSEPNFIIIWAGFQGLHWDIFAHWLQDCVLTGGNKGLIDPLVSASVEQPPAPFFVRSFMVVVKFGQGAVVELNSVVSALERQVDAFNSKLDGVLRKL